MLKKVQDELRRRFGICPTCWDRQEGRTVCAEHGARYILPGELYTADVIAVLQDVLV